MDKWSYRVMKGQERAEDQRLSRACKPICKFPAIFCTHSTAFNGHADEVLKCNYKGTCVKESGGGG